VAVRTVTITHIEPVTAVYMATVYLFNQSARDDILNIKCAAISDCSGDIPSMPLSGRDAVKMP
jgi:hypothetical protein